MSEPILSIIVPVFNEERRIPKNAERIFSYFSKCSFSYELIFVNDGSRDSTQQLLNVLEKEHACTSIQYTPNRGKGYAIRQGVFAARGTYVLFFDIDLATPLETIDAVIPLLQDKKPAVIIGNRRLLASSIRESESPTRTFLGNGYALLSRVFVPEVTDFTCGFKCFRADAAQKIFSHARIERWVFDTEILFLARHFGFPIVQIPIQWTHDRDSRVRVLRDVLSSLLELSKMVLYLISGTYRTPTKPTP